MGLDALHFAEDGEEGVLLAVVRIGIGLQDFRQGALVVVLSTMPGEEQFEPNRIEFDQLAVEYALVGTDAALYRPQVDGVDLVEHRPLEDPARVIEDDGLAGGGVELVAELVAVDESEE